MTEYTLRVPTAMCGDVIGLAAVAEAMARHAASGYGTLPLHGPTLKSLLLTHAKSLLSAARAGRLLVCNQAGYQGTVDEIIDTAKNLGDLSEVSRYIEEPDSATEVDWDMTHLFALNVRKKHLIEWGSSNGDVFHIVDAPVEVMEFGPKDEHGEFAYRGMTPRTESRDDEQSAPTAKEEAGAGTTTNDNEPDNEEIHRGLDGAPYLKKGKNSRDKVDAWVKWQAKEMVKPNDTLIDLIDRIRLEANKWGYESERKPFTNEIIRKMLPPKITGGRGKNRGKSKK